MESKELQIVIPGLEKSSLTKKELLELFNINIGKENIDHIDILIANSHECVVKNRVTGTIYIGKFAKEFENSQLRSVEHVRNITIYNDNYVKETYFHLKRKVKVLERIYFLNGEYLLTFEKRNNPLSTISLNPEEENPWYESNWIEIKLSKKRPGVTKKDIIYDYEKDFEHLYSSIFCRNSGEIMEQRYLGDFRYPKESQMDEYEYLVDGNLIHGVSNKGLEKSYYYRAICMEKSLYYDAELAKKYEPFMLRVSEMKENPVDGEVLSCFVYNVFENLNNNFVYILKYKDTYKILWTKISLHKKKDISYEFSVLTTNEGLVDEHDIEMLIAILKNQIPNTLLADVICKDMENFKHKMSIKKGELDDIIDILNPRIYANQSIEQITAFAITNDFDLINKIVDQVEEIKSGLELQNKKKGFLKRSL